MSTTAMSGWRKKKHNDGNNNKHPSVLEHCSAPDSGLLAITDFSPSFRTYTTRRGRCLAGGHGLDTSVLSRSPRSTTHTPAECSPPMSATCALWPVSIAGKPRSSSTEDLRSLSWFLSSSRVGGVRGECLSSGEGLRPGEEDGDVGRWPALGGIRTEGLAGSGALLSATCRPMKTDQG
ncbi:hypothetical protein EYF80_044775 [Liparis tanakae]|uniref:Uncharacterized protein n=1 Tax=Liparis tanakae TaxID=230148 RepID=A0A4Z2FUX1_9TELE|nr:hypothetical protein EYF80_044775 [Liparis tanakae]